MHKGTEDIKRRLPYDEISEREADGGSSSKY